MLSLLAALLLTSCSREEFHGSQTFTQTVEQAYAECSESEIRFLTGKQGIQTAFANCGSNKFAHFRWSPNGRFIYFQLTHGGHIMDGEEKTISTVPTEMPVDSAAWLRDDLLVVPLGPPEGAADKNGRLVLFNRSSNTLNTINLNLSEVRDLHLGETEQQVVLTGLDSAGVRKVVSVNTGDGQVSVPFPWLTQLDPAAGTLVYEAKAGLVGVAGPEGGVLYKADGAELGRWPGVKRVVPHPEGRYVALELDGAPVSPFDMRAWDELSEQARARELARQEEWLKRQPDWVTKQIVPPEVQIFDLQNGNRLRVTAFWGDRFQWYQSRNYYASFVMFGVEGKQLNSNVGLVDLREKLRMVDQGDMPLGLEPVAASAAPSGAAPSGAAPTDAAPSDAAPSDAAPSEEAPSEEAPSGTPD